MTLEAITWRRISFAIEIPSIIYKRADILYHRPDLKMFILGQISSKITVFFNFVIFSGIWDDLFRKWYISPLMSEFGGPKYRYKFVLIRDNPGISKIFKGPTINRKWSIWRLLWKIHLERCAVWYWTFRCHSLSFVGNSKRIFQSKFWLAATSTNEDVSFSSIFRNFQENNSLNGKNVARFTFVIWMVTN